MLTNIYTTQSDLIATGISGQRPHFAYRKPVRAIDTYEYETTFGDNFQTLSAIIFGDDTNWWALQDMNKPIDAFSVEVGTKLKLPYNIVKEKKGVKKIF